MKNLLKIIFLIDGLMAIGFGIYSWLFPFKTFGSLMLIPEMNSSLILSLLSTISLFYLLIGLISLIGIKAFFPVNLLIGVLMLVRHLSEVILKLNDLGKDWLIGNPYPDFIIHAVFILLYILGLLLTKKDVKN